MRKIASKKRVVRAYVFNAQYAKIIAYLSSGFNRVKAGIGVIFLTANTRKKVGKKSAYTRMIFVVPVRGKNVLSKWWV